MWFSNHLKGTFHGNIFGDDVTVKVDSWTPLLITILIPLYLCLLRPFFHSILPGVLKRIGCGMIFILLSILPTLVMDVYGHKHGNMTICFLVNYNYTGSTTITLDISLYYLISQYFINALGYTFFYIGSYEFICSQSPHAMKGLVIGTSFAIKGVFRSATGVLITYVPLAFG